MSNTLILHIGGGKTGTSSIQNFLSLNRKILSEHDIYVPSDDLTLDGNCSGQHVWYFANFRTYSISDAADKLEKDLKNIFSKISEKAVLISAENLSDPFKWNELFSKLKGKVKIKIVFYLRRQDEYLLSAWQQWYVKQEDDFWSWIIRKCGILADWSLIIKSWMSLVDKSDFILRVYDRSLMVNNDVISDFIQVLGLEGISFVPLENQINPSYNLGVLKLVEDNNNLFDNAHDNDFYNFISDNTANSRKISKHSPISHKQRMAILSRYIDSNNWIYDEFFRNINPTPYNRLFKMPKENDYIQLSKDELDKLKWNIMVEAVYGMYKKTKR
jgi:hypothetical protein